MTKVLIIGAGHAGGTAAALLRQYGHEGETDLETLLLRPEAFYPEQGIELRTGVTATGIDRDAKTVTFADGTVESYDALILALGSTARRLNIPGADRPELLELRTTVHAERLKAALGWGRRLAVVGGGYVGLEAAASARALGSEVVVIEREARVLARVASEPLSAFFTDLHRGQGVQIRTGAEVAAFEEGAVVLADGERIEADAILVGVGALACDALAREAGLACENGVAVDEAARTSDPSIFAIGDMTHRPVPVHDGVRVRLESVPNALEQAKQAASAITGRPAPAPEVPWFWSDQYDAKLQIAGLPLGADRQVVRGDTASGRFAVFHMAGDRIVSVEAVSAPPEFMAGKQLIGRATPVDVARLADPMVSMKEVARA